MPAKRGVKAATGRVGVSTALMRLSTPLQKQTEEGVRATAVDLLRAAGPDHEPQPVAREGSRCTTGSCSLFRSHHLPIPRSPPGVARLGHAQAGKPGRDPLRFTRDGRLAAEHGSDLLGRREQLVGLAHGEMLARLGLDMVDEGHQVAARLRRIGVRQIGLHRL